MNIEGLDYNTGRKKMSMPEYGRAILQMVEHCKQIEDRKERQRCAETIVKIMMIMFPQQSNTSNFAEKIWNHLAIISNFELDIDYPYEITKKEVLERHPDPLEYPMQKIKKRHYGHILESYFKKLKDMPEGPERDELIRLTANQMKRSLFVWNRGTADNEKVVSDLADFTDGKVQIDLNEFRFAKVDDKSLGTQTNKKKKK